MIWICAFMASSLFFYGFVVRKKSGRFISLAAFTFQAVRIALLGSSAALTVRFTALASQPVKALRATALQWGLHQSLFTRMHLRPALAQAAAHIAHAQAKFTQRIRPEASREGQRLPHHILHRPAASDLIVQELAEVAQSQLTHCHTLASSLITTYGSSRET
jgi:D-alanine-D-alanine ligase-like ATP-grasp enzyme